MLLGKTITVRLIALVGVVLALGGCGGPYLVSPGSVLGVRLTLNISTPIDSEGAASPRLLLPSTRRVDLTVEKSGTVVERKTQTFATGSSSVTFQLDLEAGVPLTVKAKAYDASGTLIVAGETSVTLTKNTSAALTLLPVKADGTSLWPTLSATDQAADGGVGVLTSLAAGASTTFVVDLKDTAADFALSATGAGLTFYALKRNGATIPVSGTVISRTLLQGDSQFLLTVFNGGTAPVSASSLGSFTIPVRSVTAPNLTVLIGQSKNATLTVSPANASFQAPSDFTWAASNSNITVDASGSIKGVAPGTTVVTATNKSTLVTVQFQVTVPPISVTGVDLSPPTLTLTPGDQATLVATVTPASASNPNVAWASSDPAVATVSSGVITAAGLGTTTITVTTLDGGLTDTTVVTVVPLVVPVSGVTLSQTTATLQLGGSLALVATVAPSNATNKAVTWESNNPAVATVVNGLVTAVSPGTAIITATTSSGAKTASATITVTGSVSVEFVPLTYGSLEFTASAVSIDEGLGLSLATSNQALQSEGTNWHVWINGALAPSTWLVDHLSVDTSELAPGQYYLDLFVTWNSFSYSGSFAFNVLSKGLD